MALLVLLMLSAEELPSYTPPPPPPLDVLRAPAPGTPPAPARPRALPQVKWIPAQLSLALHGSLGRPRTLGGEVWVGAVLGTPTRRGASQAVEGWIFAPGLEVSYGNTYGLPCVGTARCASRFLIGAGLRAGLAMGQPTLDGTWARAATFGFGQISLVAGSSAVLPAPLASAPQWAELAVRLRLGAQLGPMRSAVSGLVAFTLDAFLIGPGAGVTPGLIIGGAI